jgi:hypothetical protein
LRKQKANSKRLNVYFWGRVLIDNRNETAIFGGFLILVLRHKEFEEVGTLSRGDDEVHRAFNRVQEIELGLLEFP